MSGNSLPRPTNGIDAPWFKKRVKDRRAREKLAKASRKKKRGKN